MASEPVFIDTSFFKALLDPKDEFHAKANTIWSKLLRSDPQLITSNYILDESFTLIRKRCGLETAKILRAHLSSDWKHIMLIRATVMDETNAWNWFEKNWSNLSFTDCVSFAVMKRLDLIDVATFNTHFARAGFVVLKA